MKILPSLLSALLIGAATAFADADQNPVPLPGAAMEIEAPDTDSIPEPRSILFVGLGGLILLAFATRRK